MSLLERISPGLASSSQGRYLHLATHKATNRQTPHASALGAAKRKRNNADAETVDLDRKKSKTSKDQEKLFAPWISAASTGNSKQQAGSRLHSEVLALTSYLSATPQERSARAFLVSYITALVRQRWPARHGVNSVVTAQTFGSVATGLEIPGSDIDLTLGFPVAFSAKDLKHRLFQLAELLRSPRHANVIKDVKVVARARVPIVTVFTTKELGGYSMDISIRQSETVNIGASFSQTVEKTSDPALISIPIVRSLLAEQPALRHLILVMKQYLSSYVDKCSGKGGLNSGATCGIGSYVLVCMCAAYLSHIGLLDVKKCCEVDHAENSTSTEDDQKTILSSQPLPDMGKIIVGFLRHYGEEFDYDTNYVCAKEGGVVSRTRTREDGSTVTWLEGDKKASSLPGRLGVSCLIDADKNVAGSCSRLPEVRAAFVEALRTLENTDNCPAHESILGLVVKIPESVVIQRAQVNCTVDSGRYEAITVGQSTHPDRVSVQWIGRDRQFARSESKGNGGTAKNNRHRR